MNLSYLKYALEVERTRSISQAAENLFMGQPNLSRALRELEESIGIKIFKRSSKGVAPTEKGIEFLQYARVIVSKINDMETHFSGSGDSVQSFSVSAPRASYIAHAFSKFTSSLDLASALDLGFFETNSLKAAQNVEEGVSCLGIIRYPASREQYFMDYLDEQGLEHEEIWSFSYLALMDAGHPLANVKKVSSTDLRDFIEIRHGDLVTPYLPAVKDGMNHARKRISVYERGSQFELLSSVRGTYMWVSPVPAEMLESPRLVLRKCEGMEDIYKDVLIWRKNYEFTKLDRSFLEILKAERDSLSVIIYQ